MGRGRESQVAMRQPGRIGVGWILRHLRTPIRVDVQRIKETVMGWATRKSIPTKSCIPDQWTWHCWNRIGSSLELRNAILVTPTTGIKHAIKPSRPLHAPNVFYDFSFVQLPNSTNHHRTTKPNHRRRRSPSREESKIADIKGVSPNSSSTREKMCVLEM